MYGFKILCEISKVPFEISHKILNPYTAKYAFYDVLKYDEWWNLKSYYILNLSKRGPEVIWPIISPLGQHSCIENNSGMSMLMSLR